ncbi:hypothetical protein F3Y22_tig00002840pilonHSYRG00387 [Hibiscus syriacus]|uniref:Uncharacterized protein n=1 Tax=Hibiscus syriacus TaxID=106335 RepID=A0A6A3CRQ6_HIBSY|nr:hypothetical protein F3Y22_tig00002840pilonHSYRG00387 [Hibiscus syriacus]
MGSLLGSLSHQGHRSSSTARFRAYFCDRRLSLSSSGSRLALFRPKVDEISLLTINTSSFRPHYLYWEAMLHGYGNPMRFQVPNRSSRWIRDESKLGLSWWLYGCICWSKICSKVLPAFVANGTYTVTSFTLVLEFKKGRLQNLFWQRDGCAQCSGKSNFVCLNKQDCAINTNNCRSRVGSVDCSIGIQLAFSGTDKHSALNSWYEVENLRQYSLFGLYSNLRDSLTSQYNKNF